ncbi:23S rRNA pseudouridine955/2504/2580 synthase [Treponema bryantii]|uniref:23S rRNA pseudouridine955/2504/2580 synthase n=1 Tax=Treponema bryantii TaxID=163 RepID=A0A1H9AED4_9SPIR|nr:RluA family pseudouridine synthase [Treponema bryantii]SEP74881.1 23S rRNA pseudouridine955/2504/2580 synthase [Treponema bryantii]
MIPIIYENDEIIIINKPSGLAVQGGQGVVHSVDRDFAEQVGYKIYLVHRLDKDTSGLMVVAKNPVAAGKWTKLIGSKIVKKEYLALCAGKMPSKSGVINEEIVQHGDSKTAVTKYKVEKETDIVQTGPDNQPVSIHLSLIRLMLETGRMHQIRIHLSKNGCPIAGDDQHGNFKLNKQLKKLAGIKRLQLSAVRLTIPLEGKDKTFEVSAPFDFKFEE